MDGSDTRAADEMNEIALASYEARQRVQAALSASETALVRSRSIRDAQTEALRRSLVAGELVATLGTTMTAALAFGKPADELRQALVEALKESAAASAVVEQLSGALAAANELYAPIGAELKAAAEGNRAASDRMNEAWKKEGR